MCGPINNYARLTKHECICIDLQPSQTKSDPNWMLQVQTPVALRLMKTSQTVHQSRQHCLKVKMRRVSRTMILMATHLPRAVTAMMVRKLGCIAYWPIRSKLLFVCWLLIGWLVERLNCIRFNAQSIKFRCNLKRHRILLLHLGHVLYVGQNKPRSNIWSIYCILVKISEFCILSSLCQLTYNWFHFLLFYMHLLHYQLAFTRLLLVVSAHRKGICTVFCFR